MAAVLRPPFYVPRPAEVQPWVGAPIANLLVIALLSPVGLAPTQQRHFDYVPPPDWQYTYQRNINTLTAIQANPFIPPQWEWNYDPAPNWTWTAPPSLTIRLPAQPTFFGAPGQVPTKLWRWDYEPDKVWTGEPFSDVTSFALQAAKPSIAQLWVPRYDIDAPIWTWRMPPDRTAYLPAAVTFFGAPGQAPTKFWRYDYDLTPQIWSYGPKAAYNVSPPGPPFVPTISVAPLIVTVHPRGYPGKVS